MKAKLKRMRKYGSIFFGLTMKHYFRNFQRDTGPDVIYTISTKFFLEIFFETIDTDKDFLSRFRPTRVVSFLLDCGFPLHLPVVLVKPPPSLEFDPEAAVHPVGWDQWPRIRRCYRPAAHRLLTSLGQWYSLEAHAL